MKRNRNAIAWFEDRLQGLVEGSFGRIFRSKLQPVEISHKLVQVMEENIVAQDSRKLAPTKYNIYLNPRDYTDLEPSLPEVTTRLQDYLILTAKQRGYTLIIRPILHFIPDNKISLGQTQVEAVFENIGSSQNIPANLQNPIPQPNVPPIETVNPNATAMISPEQSEQYASEVETTLTPARDNAIPHAALSERASQGFGNTYRLQSEVTHIGRHSTNDIVINNPRVSRYHAEIRYEQGKFIIYDISSTNGVRVNNRREKQAVLKNGDVLAFGPVSFVFERR